METDGSKTESVEPPPELEAIGHLRRSLKDGCEWPVALLETMAIWTAPEETYGGSHHRYFIGGEAFDWVLLAKRLTEDMDGFIPGKEKEDLLFAGRLPASFDGTRFKDLLGLDKYRGYLNFFYGVTVEEALQLAVEGEAQKRHLSGGRRYEKDFSDEAHERLYRAPKEELLKRFRSDMDYPTSPEMSLAESKEFTYWLFKYRLQTSDGARVASDIRKGLEQLQRMAPTPGAPGDAHY